MANKERLLSRGRQRTRRILADLAGEVRGARFEAGLSQDELGRRCGLSGDKIWRLENDKAGAISVTDCCAICAVLGLDFAARAYPTGVRVRDAAQAGKLRELLAEVRRPLTYRTDVPLLSRDGSPELRGWDALLEGHGERTGVELESRLVDFQAVTRRHNLKRRDDPVNHFLLVVADTRHNRKVLRELES